MNIGHRVLPRKLRTTACLLAGAVALFPMVAAAAEAPADLVARVTIGAATCLYKESAGTDLGDYHGPGFVERNIRVTADKCPLTVFFRPDANDARKEVVFELGTIQNQPPDLGPYHVDILQGATKLASIDVPKHYRFARWRWQSAPRPIIVTRAELIKRRLVPPYDAKLTTKPLSRNPKHYTIMGLAGVTAYMPTTGERDDIGPLTEPQAEYIATGNPVALQTMMAQAEAAGTLPWHFRDGNTGAPVSYEDYPTAGSFWDKHAGGDSPWFRGTGADHIALDGAHMPTLSYLPFLLTGDPYYLEDLQFAVTFNWGNNPIAYRQRDKLLVRADQTREYAWDIRLLFQVTKATPQSVPKWLLPKAYFEKALEANREWFEKTYMDSANPVAQRFHWATALNANRSAFWQEDFLAAELTLGADLGFADWKKIARWKAQATIARTSGKSGWPRAFVSCYWCKMKDPSGTVPADWAALAKLNKFDTSKDSALDPRVDNNYRSYAEGVLALRVRVGDRDAVEPLNWLRSQPRRRPMPFKWTMAAQ